MKKEKTGNMFFEPLFLYDAGEPLQLSGRSPVNSAASGYADTYIKKILSDLPEAGEVLPVNLIEGYPQHIRNSLGSAFREDEESYAIAVSGNSGNISGSVDIYALSQRGFIYGISTLWQLINRGLTDDILLFDAPDKKLRGYRVYAPGEASFEEFKAMVDLMVYYKYNTIYIEVGGAMEYERHPEINKTWCAFCDMLHKAGPEEAQRIQKHTYWWEKNSIHFDNGDGGCISKKRMAELVAYCRERGLEVIPEVPTLSHTDYIVMAHPDIAERAEDRYPDTYCPSNPKSYELVFDILDEVIEVFDPKYINIGHDELYTVGICPRCKGKDPVELYVNDVIRINDYLKARGITGMIWCEKAFEVLSLEHPYGGAEWKEKGIPKMTGVIGKLPRDVILINWYWSLCTPEEEQAVIDGGYTVINGNYAASSHKDYRSRMKHIQGGFPSNWGSVADEYMQRNSQKTMLADTAFVFWSSTYEDGDFPVLFEKTRIELYEQYKRREGKELIEITHTTEFDKEHVLFYDGVFIVPEDWRLGHHAVTYTDGTQAKLPVIFRYNIGNQTMDADSREIRKFFGASFPFAKDGKTWYKTAYRNPYPGKKIADISFCPEMENVRVEVLK